VKLVAHRTTVVRLYAHAADTAKLVGAALYGTRDGRALPGSPLSPDGGARTLGPGAATPTSAERADASQGYTFTLPDEWTAGTISLRGQLVPAGAVLGPCGDCAFRLRGVGFADTGTERVQAVDLDAGGTAPRPATALAGAKLLQPLADGAFQADPRRYSASLDVGRIARASTLADLVAHCPFGAACTQPLDAGGRAALALTQLEDATLVSQTCKDIGAPSPCPDQIVGVHDGAALGDVSRGALDDSALPTVVAGAPAVARELGRALGRSGTSCGGLGGVGFDIRPGYRAFSGGKDYMCGGDWISASGWDDDVTALSAYAHAHARSAAAAPAAGLRVLAFSLGGGPVVIWSVRPAVAIAPPAVKGGYRAVVRSRTGRTLGTGSLRAEQLDAGSPADLLLDGIMPLRGGSATRVPSAVTDVVVQHGSDRAAARTRSAHAPTVRLTTAKPGRVAWKARDADGDTLLASVDYSADGGRSFRTVWSGPSTGRVSLPRALFGRSGNGEARVRVSDGFDQASATSKPFRAAGHAPDVQLDLPGKTLLASSPLRLAGSAYDDGFAPLGEHDLRWTVDGRDGAGGPRGTVDGLAAGRHTVRLVATDSAGRRATARVRVTVAAVTPAPLSIAAPAKLDRAAASLALTVRAVVPCRLTVAGKGLTTTRARVTRAATQVSVPVKPGASDLRLTLTFRSGRAGTRDALTVSR
jgi:hypothetical protein